MSLALRNLLFTVVVPGSGGVLIPWWLVTRSGATPAPRAWYGGVVMAAGVVLLLACIRVFAVVGGGTPGPWDPPQRLVAVGPYRWVRNPIYVAALLIVLGEAWLFQSLSLLGYGAGVAIFFHLLVISYQEPTLVARFGEQYEAYARTVSRWIPRPPRTS